MVSGGPAAALALSTGGAFVAASLMVSTGCALRAVEVKQARARHWRGDAQASACPDNPSASLALYKPRVFAYRAKLMLRAEMPIMGAETHSGREQNVNLRRRPCAPCACYLSMGNGSCPSVGFSGLSGAMSESRRLSPRHELTGASAAGSPSAQDQARVNQLL